VAGGPKDEKEKNVSHSLCFLTATWLAAQTGQPVYAQASPGQVIIEAAPDNGAWQQQQPAPRRGVLYWLHDRIGGLFGRHRSNEPSMQPQQQQQPGIRQVTPQQPGINYNEPPLFQPTSQMPVGPKAQATPPAPVAQASHSPEPTPLNLPISEKYREQIGHETDYSWITGQLYRFEADGRPLWVIRYATPEIQDTHGGSVVLVPAMDLHNYRNGDLVSVQGQLLNGGARSEQVNAPLYRASDINLIERGE
jgi:hypothetical protein